MNSFDVVRAQILPLVLKKEQLEPWLYDLKSTESFLKSTPPLLEKKLLDAQIGLW